MSLDPLALRIASLESISAFAIIVVYALFSRSLPGATTAFAGRVELRVEEGNLRKTVRLPLPITIGRSDDAQLRLIDPHASRLHALLDVEDGTAFVEDLGSRNGTRVNARPIAGRTLLTAGDDIRVGRAKIVFSGEVPWT